jgi:hypothetical protein
MAESIQAYYEKLIAQQSESIRKYLVKYGLTEWDKVAPTLTNKEKGFILRRYREGVYLRAVSFFRKIVTRAQLNDATQKTTTVVKAGKKTTKKVNNEVTIKSINEEKTKHRSLQEYYMYLVSKLPPSIRSFLRQNDLLRYENAFIWLEDSDYKYIMDGYTKGVRLQANDLGGIFSKLCTTFKSHQTKSNLAPQLQQTLTQHEEPSKVRQIDKPKLARQETHRPTLLLQQIGMQDLELARPETQEEFLPIKSKLKDSTSPCLETSDKLFVQWLDRLPKWYIEVLMKNGCTSFGKFIEEISKPSFSYEGIKHCEQETVDDLKMMAAVLIWLHSQLENNALESDETTSFLLSKLSDSNLSIRAINCLLLIDVITIKDLLPLSRNVLLAIRNCGRGTAFEIEQYIESAKKKLGIPESITSLQIEKFLSQKTNKQEVPSKSSQIHESLLSQLAIFEMFIPWKERISPIAISILLENGFESYNDFIEKTSKPTFSFKGLKLGGQKTTDELSILASFMTPQSDKPIVDPIKEYICNEDYEFVRHFKDKHGHWPMVYILLSYMWSSLNLLDFVAFEEYYGIIRLDEETDELTRHLVRQSYDKISKKVRLNPHLKKLCEHKDWNLYCVNNIPISVFGNEGEDDTWRKIEMMISQEKYFLNNYIRERASSEEDYKYRTELLSHISLSTFKVFLQFWGHLPLWIDSSNKSIVPYCPPEKKGYYDPNFPIVIDRRFTSFKLNKALAEINRLQKEKTTNDIILSIEKLFVDNEDYWNKKARTSSVFGQVSDAGRDNWNQLGHLSNEYKTSLMCILKELFKGICHANVVNDDVILKANTIDYSDKLYEILSIWRTRLHRDELFKRLKEACEEKGLGCNLSSPSQLTRFLASDPRIISYGKSSYWGLKEWGESNGSIRELAIQFVKKSKGPIHIDDLTKLVMGNRPDSNEKSISSIIRQTTSTGELLLFIGDYIGHPQAKYANDYILMPRSFDEWLIAFRDYVLKNKRFPTAGLGFEGLLYRWYQKASQLTELSPDEIVKFDALEKELAHYPHNTNEYNFLHNCNLYKLFVEGNNRMLEETDDPELFKWFYSASRNYTTYNDNRNQYFKQLLQYLSSKMY